MSHSFYYNLKVLHPAWVLMKQSSISPLEKGLIPSPFALQVKIFIHLVTVGLSSSYPIGIFTAWKAEFARVTPSSLVLAAPEHRQLSQAD